MPRSKTAGKEAAILEAASRVFALRPFHEVLIDDIAADAGIGKGTIYRYFETKDDLYFATSLYALDHLAAALEQARSPNDPAAPRLERIAREILGFFWERRHLVTLLARYERTDREAEILKRRESIVQLVQEAILSGIERREFRGIDARIGAELFLGMTRSVNLFRRPEDTLDELVAHVIGVFSHGVVRP
ncbi:MAG: TetR/AcrR family transcriptional regulator [Acidobacteriota bacterium]